MFDWINDWCTNKERYISMQNIVLNYLCCKYNGLSLVFIIYVIAMYKIN